MNFVELVSLNRLDEAKEKLFAHLEHIVASHLEDAKRYVASEQYEEVELDEAKRNPNIVKQGRITKIRRRIRRNAKGRIVVQKNKRRSGIKGYAISGNTVKRIPATVRLRKQRLLKRSWKTTRRAKLRRSLLKRKMSMRRRASMGLR